MPRCILVYFGLLAACAAEPHPVGGPPAAAWRSNLAAAKQRFEAGEVAVATQLAEAALAGAESELGADDLGRLEPLLMLSSLYLMQGRFEQAEPAIVHAHQLAEEELTRAYGRVATSLKYLGAVYAQTSRLDEAERVQRRAIEIATESVGVDDPETAKHVGNLGALVLQRGRLDEAESLLERAIRVWDAAPRPHPTYGPGAMFNLAELYLQKDREEEAIALYRRGVAIQEAAFGAGDPRLVNTLRRFSAALRKAGLEAEAREVDARR